jgi:Zinc carboxypeptidase
MTATVQAPGFELFELHEIERIVARAGPGVMRRFACEVSAEEARFAVPVIVLGNPSPQVPAVGLFGGVHGLERIGTAVVVAYLNHLVMRLAWDVVLQRQLEAVRLVFMPLVNPGGMWRNTRANPQGVDLMRNAPVESKGPVPWLVGGQRRSRELPWYRGAPGAPMEVESRALCRVVEEELLSAPFSVAVDCHSGFGLVDRLWFPMAHTAEPIRHLAELHALIDIFEGSHPNHPYVIEPQSRQYLTHGDLWDHLYQLACARPETVFLPLTLEMGSWLWIKKNPRQLLSRRGIFNPLIEHRHQRVLRRHLPLLDFVTRAACSAAHWLPGAARRSWHTACARARWYAPPRR